jgi:SAM-dependent methyltransferase
MAFPETSYGIVKRLDVVEAWAYSLSARLGRETLSILDVGCGTGDHLTYPLALLNHQVLGVDFHEASIQEARCRYVLPNLTFRSGQLDVLLQERSVFDLVICSEVLEHLYQPKEFLCALRRMVRPNGALIITTPNGYGSYEILCRLQRGLQKVGVDQVLRGLVHAHRRSRANALHEGGQPIGVSPVSETAGFLNVESGHVQFFRAGALSKLFGESGFLLRERRARTLLCGPYVDVLLRLPPFRQAVYKLNNCLADLLPFSWSADWMFLLEPDPKSLT